MDVGSAKGNGRKTPGAYPHGRAYCPAPLREHRLTAAKGHPGKPDSDNRRRGAEGCESIAGNCMAAEHRGISKRSAADGISRIRRKLPPTLPGAQEVAPTQRDTPTQKKKGKGKAKGGVRSAPY